jgi:hypothetical protein
MGVALTSCTVPALGEPTFEIDAQEMEMGVGIHGERGHKTMPLATATEIVKTIAEAIEADLKPQKGQSALLHINGLGATPLMEQYLIYDLAEKFWQKRGINITRSLVGNYTTSFYMQLNQRHFQPQHPLFFRQLKCQQHHDVLCYVFWVKTRHHQLTLKHWGIPAFRRQFQSS